MFHSNLLANLFIQISNTTVHNSINFICGWKTENFKNKDRGLLTIIINITNNQKKITKK